MTKLGQAIRLAAQVHEQQFDKAGAPYILHSLAVMNLVGDEHVTDAERETLMIIAVLHDSWEDFLKKHGATKKDLLRLKEHCLKEFGQEVYDALDALSHRPGETYDPYIDRVALNWRATIVKIKDLTHNMDPRRIPAYQIVDKDFQRWDKYRKALIRLERE